MSKYRILAFLVISSLLAGCSAPAGQAVQQQPSPGAAENRPTAAPQTAPQTIFPTATTAPTLTPAQPVAPSTTPTADPTRSESQASVTNPLTGLKVSRPELLNLPPAMVSVSNFPVTARPQAGLSQAAFVFEVYVGEGMTRFLAVYYGDLPQVSSKSLSVGPMRSGRLPYEPLRGLFGGFLLIASGDVSVVRQLNYYTNIWGSGADVNGTFVDAATIEKLAQAYQKSIGSPALAGLTFSGTLPAGGKDGRMLWLPYNFANQVLWRFDPASGSYNRWQDQYDGTTFVKMTDRLDSQPLAFENLVVLFANHNALQSEKIEIYLGGVSKAPALLFRDGKMYEIFWSSLDKEYADKTGRTRVLRFLDAQGNPLALKPGQTWVEVVTAGSSYYETVDSTVYGDLVNKKTPGSGNWAVRFFAPIPQK